MKLTFIGTGYVGLVTGVMMSHCKHDVTCLDIDQKKIDTLNNGESPIYEDGLVDFIVRQTKECNLHFTRVELGFPYRDPFKDAIQHNQID